MGVMCPVTRLKTIFQQSLNYFGPAQTSFQIYRELQSLEKDGWLPQRSSLKKEAR